MAATNSTTSIFLVAIDISKHRHEILIGIPGKKRRRRMTIRNTLDDFQCLTAALASYDLPVRIGFEATGNCHRPLAHHLGLAGFDLKLVSSVGVARKRPARADAACAWRHASGAGGAGRRADCAGCRAVSLPARISAPRAWRMPRPSRASMRCRCCTAPRRSRKCRRA